MIKLFVIILVINIIDSGVVDNGVLDCESYISKNLKAEIASYQPIVNRIIRDTLNGPFKSSTYDELATFVDKFGNRLAGTQNLENAIDYMLEKSKMKNLENVHGEEAPVETWIR